MKSEALFGISILMSFIAFGIVVNVYIWPNVRNLQREAALVPLIVPHVFRFVGLSFLVPGVVGPSLQSSFAVPAAYGDLIAAVLAATAIWALRVRASWTITLVWVFNLWGTADLLFAVYQGEIGVRIDAGTLGAAFYIPTLIVPALLILHILIFRILVKTDRTT